MFATWWVGTQVYSLARGFFHSSFPVSGPNRFLDTLGSNWNIVIHYRNHGAADGMVLVGFQIPDNQQTAFLNIYSNWVITTKSKPITLHIDSFYRIPMA